MAPPAGTAQTDNNNTIITGSPQEPAAAAAHLYTPDRTLVRREYRPIRHFGLPPPGTGPKESEDMDVSEPGEEEEEEEEVQTVLDSKPDMRFEGPVIVLCAGPRKAPFFVHRALAMSESSYFAAECAEKGQSSFDLTAEDTNAIGILVRFLYRGEPPLTTPSPTTTSSSSSSNISGQALAQLAKAYLLAIKFDFPKLAHKALGEISALLGAETDTMISSLGDREFAADLHARLKVVHEVYQGTEWGSDPLRRELVGSMARHWPCFGTRGFANGPGDGGMSELGRFMEASPRFSGDLSQALSDSMQKLSSKKRKRVV